MKKKFKEIRVFVGNETIGHDFFHIEFVYNNNFLQNQLMKLNGDSRVRYSRSKSNEFIFNADNDSNDFLKGFYR